MLIIYFTAILAIVRNCVQVCLLNIVRETQATANLSCFFV